MKKRGLFFKDKRGLSSIVITLIITLLALVAIGVVWVVIQNLLSTGSSGIGLAKFTVNLKITNAYEKEGNISVFVTRTVGAGNLNQIKFILSDNSNSEVITEDTAMQELESGTFSLRPSKLVATQILSVSVAPVIKMPDGTESLGDITDTYYLSTPSSNQTNIQNNNQTNNQNNNQTNNPTSPGAGQCTPDCTNLQCGFDPLCGVLCGTCSGTDLCTNGVCVPLNCIPESQAKTCGTWNCGTRVNNCGAEIDCGTCSSGTFCHQGLCSPRVPLNSGTVQDTWPGNSGLYFGSSNLPTTISYQNYYISFRSPSAETNCLLIALYRFPVTGYDKSHIGFDFATSIKTGDTYDIWQTVEECQTP